MTGYISCTKYIKTDFDTALGAYPLPGFTRLLSRASEMLDPDQARISTNRIK